MSLTFKLKRISVFMLFGVFLYGTIGCVLPSYAALDKARAAGLEPHKALYKIELLSKNSSAKVSNIYGQMFYEWRPSCDAWITNHSFDITYDYIETPPMRITSNFTTYEGYDGESFNFSSQRKSEGILLEEMRGNVQKDDTKNMRTAVYSIPEGLEFYLPEDTIFPMAHTLNVLEKVKSKQKMYEVTLFDGSDEKGPVTVNSFIGAQVAWPRNILMNDKENKIDRSLVKEKGWNIRLAFFPTNMHESASDYEMSVIFHENGIISDMKVDYSDFSITQRLVALESLESEPLEELCQAGQKKSENIE